MKKLISFSFLLIVALFAAVASAGGPYVCALWNPFQNNICMVWRPNLLPGASYVAGTTNPDSGHFLVCTGSNFQGYCELVPIESIGDLSQFGWNTTTDPIQTALKINSIKVGPGRTVTEYPFTNQYCPPFWPCMTWSGQIADTSSYVVASVKGQ